MFQVTGFGFALIVAGSRKPICPPYRDLGEQGTRGIIYAFRHVWQTNRPDHTAWVVTVTGRLRESFVRGAEKPGVTAGQGM